MNLLERRNSMVVGKCDGLMLVEIEWKSMKETPIRIQLLLNLLFRLREAWKRLSNGLWMLEEWMNGALGRVQLTHRVIVTTRALSRRRIDRNNTTHSWWAMRKNGLIWASFMDFLSRIESSLLSSHCWWGCEPDLSCLLVTSLQWSNIPRGDVIGIEHGRCCTIEHNRMGSCKSRVFEQADQHRFTENTGDLKHPIHENSFSLISKRDQLNSFSFSGEHERPHPSYLNRIDPAFRMNSLRIQFISSNRIKLVIDDDDLIGIASWIAQYAQYDDSRKRLHETPLSSSIPLQAPTQRKVKLRKPFERRNANHATLPSAISHQRSLM